MMEMIFFTAFGLTVLYLVLSGIFIDKVSLLDGDVVEDRWFGKNANLVMKYIFFLKSMMGFPGYLKILLIFIRFIFLSAWILYLVLLFIIIYNQA